jgi:hypothetical protein
LKGSKKIINHTNQKSLSGERDLERPKKKSTIPIKSPSPSERDLGRGEFRER